MYASVSSWFGSQSASSLSSESASLSESLSSPLSSSAPSVLEQLRTIDAGASSAVVHHVVAAAQHLHLHDDQQVRWFSQVLCHGLSLELNEHATVKSCVNVYCRWLDALLMAAEEDEQLIRMPQVVRDDPNVYARLACRHLVKLFLPRKADIAPKAFVYCQDFAQESIQKQAVLCHRVLRKIQDVAHQSEILESDTWNALLIFLLEVNQALLAPPATPDDVGEQLCERVLSALVSVWLISCVKSFPLPSLWKSFRQLAMQWRHRVGVVEMWNKVNLALTHALIQHCYGPNFGKGQLLQTSLEAGDEVTLPKDMTPDCIAQTWFRFLHTLGPPNELCEAWAVSQTQHFFQYAIEAQQVVDPSQHPCLNQLPVIFLKAMKGVSALVDAFLGLSSEWSSYSSSQHLSTPSSPLIEEELASAAPLMSTEGESATPPAQRRSFLLLGLGGLHQPHLPHAVQRRMHGHTINFRAMSVDVAPAVHSMRTSHCNDSSGLPKAMGLSRSTSTTSTASTTTVHQPLHQSALSLHSIAGTLERPSLSPDRSSVNSLLHLFGRWLLDSIIPKPSMDSKEEDKFESGRAEAAGTLCRIICSKKTDESVLVAYLTQFYEALSIHLQPQQAAVGEVGVMVIINCEHLLLQLDLQGVHVLLPVLLYVLEIVLQSENDSRLRMPSTVSRMQLRRSAIKMLMSMLSLPSHFQDLTLLSLDNNSSSSNKKEMTFRSLRPRMLNLVMTAIQLETDSVNIHMLLGGLMFLISDTAFMQAEVQQSKSPASNDISGVYVRALHLVCQRLINHWKSDLNASLAALEFLSALAMLQISSKESSESIRAITWICDFIVVQCSKPPQYHSKDLHSTIVAAFKCLNTWLLYHKQCLKDRSCLITIIEVAELGISGSKSINNSGNVFKDDKKLNPASGRVRDAAEILLTTLMEQVDHSNKELIGAEDIDEVSIMTMVTGRQPSSLEEAVRCFDYFCMDASIIIAILKDDHIVRKGDTPEVYVIMRTAWSGRFGWHMALQQGKTQDQKATSVHNMQNKLQPQEPRNYHSSEGSKHAKKFFPDEIERIPLCKADRSIPSSESVAQGSEVDESLLDHLDNLSMIVDKQIELEKRQHMFHSSFDKNIKPPQTVQSFQSARLLLNHLGLLTLSSSEHRENRSRTSSLLRLQTTNVFAEDIRRLDTVKTCLLSEHVAVFYVKKGQNTPQEICNNQLDQTSALFLDFLQCLGEYDNKEQKWSDKQAEISFGFVGHLKKEDLSQIKLAILWMESLDDALTAQQVLTLRYEVERTKSDDQVAMKTPATAVLNSSCSLLLLQPTASGLIRVRMPHNIASKMQQGSPLVDGMSIRGASVGWLVRQTALNVAMRWRLARTAEGPQSRRKTIVQEIVDKHRREDNTLISNLF